MFCAPSVTPPCHPHSHVRSTSILPSRCSHSTGHAHRHPQHFDGASVTPSQSASQVIDHDRSHIPLGQRYTSHFEDVEEHDGVPSDTDSEEDYRRAFIEPRLRMPAPHELGVAADTHDSFIPQAPVNGSAPPPPPRKDDDAAGRVPMPAVPTAPRFDVNHVRGHSQDTSTDKGFNPANAQSWSSQQGGGAPYSPPRYSMSRRSIDSEGGYGHQRKSSNSLIGKMSRLFKTDIRNGALAEDESHSGGGGWNTRTSANVEQENERRRFTSLRRAEPDSSDEEDEREVFRNVNQHRPGWEANANSDVGGKKPISRILPGPKSNRVHEAEQAEIERIRASVVGGGIGGATPNKPIDRADSTTTATKKKKKKRPQAGSEVGTAPTRPSASYTVSGDLSSLHGNVAAADTSARPALSRSSTLKSTSSKKKNRASIASTGLVGGNIFNPNAGKYGADSWIKKPASQMTAYEAVAMAGVVPKTAALKEKPAATTPAAASTAPPSLAPLPATPAAGNTSRPPSVMSSASQKPPLKSALKTPALSRSNSTASAKATPLSPTKKSAATLPTATLGTPGAPIKSALRHDITQSIRAEPTPQPKMGPIPKAPAPVTSTPLPETVAPSKPAVEEQRAATAAAAQAPAASQPAVKQPSITAKVAAPVETSGTVRSAAPQSVLSIEEDKGFDGTGRLDVPVGAGEAQSAVQDAKSIALQPKVAMPKLEMPSSEPFSVSFDGSRRGSAVTNESAADEVFLTPGAEQTYKAFIQEHGQSPSIERSANATPLGVKQADGVARLTDRKVKIEPSRVYGTGAPEVSDTSSEEASPIKPSYDAEEGAQKALQVQASSALADPTHQPDASLQGLSGTPVAGAAPALAVASLSPMKANNASSLAMAKAPSDNGSVVSRRKSVRMAPDVKLPPDTPTDVETPRGTEHSGKDPIAARGSQLSSRIAPPPPAPAKATKEAGPIDLGGGRQTTSWTSRVRDTVDSSSDEEDADDDGYSSARKAFGSASRDWAEAMGTVKPKTKKTAGDTGSVRSASKKTSAAKASASSNAAATVAPVAPPPSIGYVPTAPGPISSTLYTAKAPGSSVGVGASQAVPSTSMYSVTAPDSVVSGSALPSGAPTAASAAPVANTPTGTRAGATAATVPAPLTASNLNALDSKDRPEMPPVPVAPPAQGQTTISVPTAPPPAISGKAASSVSKSGFFRRFKRNK